MLRQGILLVVAVTVFALVSTLSYQEFAYASSSHPFQLEWGESGLSKAGFFSYPQFAAVDDEGNIYVTDLGNRRIQKFDNNGTFLLAWGTSGSGSGQFHTPAGVAVYENFVYVVDSQLNNVQQFDLNGNFIAKWGERGNNDAQFLLPNGIAAGTNGTLYVVDTGNHRIQVFSSDGNFTSSFGVSGPLDENLQTPIGIAIDKNNFAYISEPNNNKIKKFDLDGNFIQAIGPNVAGFSISPQGMAVDTLGNLYVADTSNDRILEFDQEGNTKTSWGGMGVSPGLFKFPKDITIDSNGFLFVVDSYGHRIQKFSSPSHEQISNSQTTETPEQTQPVQTGSAASVSELPPVNPVPGDLTKPEIFTPNDLLIEATGGLTPISIGQAIATDQSGIQSLENNAPDKFPLGETTVIWTAIDGSGNVGIATQRVAVMDTVPPTIGEIENVAVEATHPISNLVTLNAPGTSDLVGVISISNNAPDVFPIGDTLVTWTAVDVASNTATAIQLVSVVDTTSPTLSIPSDIIVEATSVNENYVFLGEPTVIDNGEIVSITNDSPEFFSIGNTTVNWIAADASGNMVTSKQKVSVIDTKPPKIEAPLSIDFEAISTDSNTIALVTPNVTDVQLNTITNDAPSVFPIGDTIVTWSAVDGSGNQASSTQVITVRDTTPPSIDIPETITAEATSLEKNVVDLGEIKADDISGITSITTNSPEKFPFGITEITWTVTDSYGNSATVLQTVKLIDTTPPSNSPPKDLVLEATNSDNNAVDLGKPSANDIIGLESVTNDAPETFPIGMTTINWNATDTSGNSAISSQIVTVVDTTSPTIIAPGDISIEATSSSGISVDIGTPIAEDLVSVPTITNNSPEKFYLGNNTVIWTAVDANGNSASADQTVMIIDTTSPSIIPPPDVIVEAENPTSNVIAIGVANAQDIVGIESLDNNAPNSFPLGDTLVTWTARDAAGNLASATQKISVIDSVPPTITSPEPITMEATSELENQILLEAPTAFDAIGIKSITSDSTDIFPLGETIVTWTAVDLGGLESTTTQIVDVVDTTPPSITNPRTVTVEATNENNNIVDLGPINAIDKVGISSITNDAPEVFPLGMTTVNWTVTDESGNTASAQQKVSIVDTKAPTLSAPSDVTVEATHPTDNLITLGIPEADDNVGILSVENNAPDSFLLGQTIVTWTAQDISGNSVNATQIVSAIDTTPPSALAPENIEIEAISENKNVVSLIPPEASDVISEVETTNDEPEFYPLGLTTVTWKITDESGNTSTVTQQVSVVDTVAPTITPPSDIVAEVASPTENIVSTGNATASDLVGISSVTNDAPETFPYGETIVTWIVTDTSNNVAQSTQSISVIDTTAPIISPPTNLVVEASTVDSNLVEIGVARASDIMAITSITNDAPEVFGLGDTVITWTATDEAGNSATSTQKITVVDTTAPELFVPENVVFDTKSLLNEILIGDSTAIDFIDSSPVITNNSTGVFPLGTTTVMWNAVDMFGNSVNQSQTVEVQACGKPIEYYNQIMGTTQDDVLTGTNLADLIFGLEGDDIISGSKGNDCIFGGLGDDILFGNEGNDNLSGDEGTDVIKGQSGEDLIDGGSGLDVIDGGDDTDSCNALSESDEDLKVKCEL